MHSNFLVLNEQLVKVSCITGNIKPAFIALASVQKQVFRIYKSQNDQTEESLLSYLQLTHLSIYSLCVKVLFVHVLSRNNNRTRVCWSPIDRRPFHASLQIDGELLYQPKPKTSQPSQPHIAYTSTLSNMQKQSIEQSRLLSLLLHPLLHVKSTKVTLRCHSKQRREGMVYN